MSEPLTIHTLTPEGLGLNHESALQIPFTLPGEKILASKPFKKRGKRLSEALEIVAPSPLRIDPTCPHFGSCGGCLTQHLPYDEELRWKEEGVKSLFSSFPPHTQFPMIGAKKLTQWRSKMEFTFSSEGRLGLHRFFGKSRVFDVEQCSLGPLWFQEALQLMRAFQEEQKIPSFHPFTSEGSLRNLTLRHGYRTDERMILVTVSGDARFAWKQSQLSALKEKLSPLNASLFLILQQAIKGRPTQFFEMHLAGREAIEERLLIRGEWLKFQISPRAFFQPHPFQAEQLYERTFDLLDLQGDETLIDLFAGTGTLGLIGSRMAQRVYAVELSPEACLDARANCLLNGVENMEFLQGDVEKILAEGRLPPPDALVIDPPRSGLTPKARELIANLKPKKLAYISCNPKSQAVDLSFLLERGWRLEAIQSPNQFPRTPHVENIALLTLGVP